MGADFRLSRGVGRNKPPAPIVGTTTPPTRQVTAPGGKMRKAYDMTQPAGDAAAKLLQSWSGAMTPDMPAPWRQTGGGGGSEFGKPKWLVALKACFKTTADPPHFTPWQLGLADHVARRNTLHTHVAGPINTRAMTATQAGKLVRPTNHKAVGVTVEAAAPSRAGGDTDSGVKKWMEKLSDKLKGVNPPPVTIPSESQEAGQPVRLELSIEGHAEAPGAARDEC